MAATAGAGSFGIVETGRRSRVLCGSCRRYFLAPRPAPGSRVSCTMCDATVEVGERIVQRRLTFWSGGYGGYFAAWMDDGRGAASDAFFRLVICAALVVGALVVVLGFAETAVDPLNH